MTEIKFTGGCTFRGTAEGDHGVFTGIGGRVFAGQIAGDCACIGVLTDTRGNTYFVECDADGEFHGRVLGCDAGGDTEYYRCEHGSDKEVALLRADGTCEYNYEACRADYAPFVALQAMVSPIKARPRTSAPNSRLSLCRIFSPPPPANRSNRPLVWHSQELATTHADKVRARRLRHQPLWALWHSNCQANAPRVQPGRRTGGRVHHACATTACVVHPSAVRARAANPHAPPLSPSLAARPRGASRSAAGCPCRLYTPRAARTPTHVAVAFRTARLHSGPISRT
jgi:hypothetical protein